MQCRLVDEFLNTPAVVRFFQTNGSAGDTTAVVLDVENCLNGCSLSWSKKKVVVITGGALVARVKKYGINANVPGSHFIFYSWTEQHRYYFMIYDHSTGGDCKIEITDSTGTGSWKLQNLKRGFY